MADRDPLRALVDYLDAGEGVPFEWAVQHGSDGRDPVTAAWRASTDPNDLLSLAGRVCDAVAIGAAVQAVVALAQQRPSPRPSEPVVAAYRARLRMLRSSLEFLEARVREHPERGDLASWFAQDTCLTAQGLMCLPRGRAEPTPQEARRARDAADAAIANTLRAHLPTPTLASLTRPR